MRVCLRNSDQRILESQSNDAAPLDALLANAVATGYAADEVTVQVIDNAIFAAMLAAQQKASMSPILTFLQFMALFTPAEQAAIVSSTDTQTKLFLVMASGTGTVKLDHSEVIAGVKYIATAPTAAPPGPGLIAPSRVSQILGGQLAPS